MGELLITGLTHLDTRDTPQSTYRERSIGSSYVGRAISPSRQSLDTQTLTILPKSPTIQPASSYNYLYNDNDIQTFDAEAIEHQKNRKQFSETGSVGSPPINSPRQRASIRSDTISQEPRKGTTTHSITPSPSVAASAGARNLPVAQRNNQVTGCFLSRRSRANNKQNFFSRLRTFLKHPKMTRHVTTTTTTTRRPSLMERLRGRRTRRVTRTTHPVTTTHRHHHTTAAPVHHHRRRPSLGDKVSGGLMKLRGTLTRRPGLKVSSSIAPFLEFY